MLVFPLELKVYIRVLVIDPGLDHFGPECLQGIDVVATVGIDNFRNLSPQRERGWTQQIVVGPLDLIAQIGSRLEGPESREQIMPRFRTGRRLI